MTDLTMSQFASKDDLLAAQAARIAELESQLEAIGAGGVEPLRKQAAQAVHQIAEPAAPVGKPIKDAIDALVMAAFTEGGCSEHRMSEARIQTELRKKELCTLIAATQPAAQGMDALTPAARDVLAERQRQISAEGWTPESDDRYAEGDMSDAAGCYALHAFFAEAPTSSPPAWWPWAAHWWKPSTPRRDLEKAGALILAEIERIDRAAALAAQAKQGGAV